jgi:5-methylthioadenosine/S-adenosylhomocysteine deaminase
MRLLPDLVLVDGRFEPGRVVEIDHGRITGVVPFPPAWGDAAFADDLVRLPGRALLPGTVNAHCHTFQSLLRGLGDDMDFMSWRDRVLYPFSTRLDREGI